MIESFKRLDIFTQPIQFNSIEQATVKRTFAGALLSVVVLILSLGYFIYQSYLYLGNKIDPIFRSQAFVRNDLISIPLEDEFIAFEYIQYMIVPNQKEFDQNKTYISYVARLQYQSKEGLETVFLDIIQCKNPNLSGLLCVDFQQLKNRVLVYDFNNSIISSVMVYAYRCQDTDQFKTFVPDNCASPEEINEYISQQNFIMAFKVQQQQFNITSQKMQANYKNQFVSIDSSLVMISEFKIQLQHTEIVQGSFIQKQTSHAAASSFIVNQYSMNYQSYSQNENSKYFACTAFDVDEQVFFTQIKFPTFPEVLAICNSTFALLMCLGFIARKLSFTLIKDQMLLMYMQNVFQGQYLSILEQNKILNINNNNNKYSSNGNDNNNLIQNQEDQADSQSDEKFNQIFIPNLKTKQSGRVMSLKNKKDFFLETLNDRKQKDKQKSICLSESIETDKKRTNSNETHFKFDESEIKIFNQAMKQNFTEKTESKTEQQVLSTRNTIHNFRIFSPTSSPDQKKQKQPFNSVKQRNKSKTIHEQIFSEQSSNILEQNMPKIDKIAFSENLKQKLDAYSNLQLTKNLQNILFSFKQSFLQIKIIFNKKQNKIQNNSFKNKSQYEQSKGLNPKTREIVEQQFYKSLDFIHLQKEMIFLKKAIMVLLSKDQFAMIPLIGCSEKSIDYIYNNPGQNRCIQEERKLNHFEELLALSLNNVQKNESINYFLEKCKNLEGLSEIDKRILCSVI